VVSQVAETENRCATATARVALSKADWVVIGVASVLCVWLSASLDTAAVLLLVGTAGHR
jgi:hypothetical protein